MENNNSKKVGIIIGVVVVLVVLLVTFFFDRKYASVPVVEQSSEIPSGVSQILNTPPVKTTPEYTLAQVAAHPNSTSCWSIVRTGVYDLTSWIKNHPGGSKAILGICGKDATTTFLNQHEGQKNPEQALKTFLIGNYKK